MTSNQKKVNDLLKTLGLQLDFGVESLTDDQCAGVLHTMAITIKDAISDA